MFPRITIRNLATTILVFWGLAFISWYYYNIQFFQDNGHSDGIHPAPINRKPLHRSTPTMPPTNVAGITPKTVIWKERNPYSKLIMEAVNLVIGRNEDWKVHDGCSDEIINYASIPLAVNTLTLTTALLRYLAIVALRAKEKFKFWYEQPHVQKVLRQVIEVAKHTIDVYEL